MKKHLILLLVFLGSACAPVPFLSPTATPIPTSTPIPTPTQISLSDLDIGPILVIEGDLPEDLVPDIIVKENAIGSAEELDRAELLITQYFLLNGGEGGGVNVFLFESLDNVQAAFGKVATFMSAPVVDYSVGDQARVENFLIPVMPGVQSIEGSRLIFSRCHALVVIQFPRADDVQEMMRYGKLLDTRIQPLVCREN